MQRPTLSNFRSQFPIEVMGMCAADPGVISYCNDATERLKIDPLCPDEGWAFDWITMNLSVSVTNGSAYVTTPQEIVRLIVMDVCTHPIRIRNGFWEYMKFGPGLNPKTCAGRGCGGEFEAIERDNVVTLADLQPTPQKLRFYPTDARDSGLMILPQGLDQNNKVILTTNPVTGLSAPGEYVTLAFPFVDSANTFSKVQGLLKDQTFGPVEIFQVDPTTGVELPLSSMEGNEQSAWYRRYGIFGIPNTNLCCASPSSPIQIQAQGRIGFMAVQNETDYLSLACVPAIIEEAISLRYAKMDSASAAQQSQLHHSRAINLLNGQMDQIYGKVNTAVRVPIFGSNRLRPSFR